MPNLRRNTTSKRQHRLPRKSRGQALVELALLGLFLGMLLAAAVDLGRAYFTAVVVTNMAGEGAAYASLNPEKDLNAVGTNCTMFPVLPNKNIQDRARRVATERGLIIREPSQADIAITPACTSRCVGTPITVKVTYRLNDLFLPALLGINSITISKSASQLIMEDVEGASCP